MEIVSRRVRHLSEYYLNSPDFDRNRGRSCTLIGHFLAVYVGSTEEVLSPAAQRSSTPVQASQEGNLRTNLDLSPPMNVIHTLPCLTGAFRSLPQCSPYQSIETAQVPRSILSISFPALRDLRFGHSSSLRLSCQPPMLLTDACVLSVPGAPGDVRPCFLGSSEASCLPHPLYP
ncbi:hypothetical protein GY45DRAFT_1325564 [Cubamyces sp. BRFM 1775]|nr:hypothetical protein GY45DRAFT_1325564 [Cubamyces sp. BRFM 1775]